MDASERRGNDADVVSSYLQRRRQLTAVDQRRAVTNRVNVC